MDNYTLFLSLWIEALPFLIFGILLSSYLLVFVDKIQLLTLFPRNRFSCAIVGSLLGILFPVSQYGNVPVTARLLMENTPVSLAISFFIAAPTINPFTIWLSWKAFPNHPQFFWLRIILVWAIAVIIGCFFKPRQQKQIEGKDGEIISFSKLVHSSTFLPYQELNLSEKPLSWKVRVFFKNTIEEFFRFSLLLFGGCFVATIFQIFWNPTWAFSPGKSDLTIILLMILLSIFLPLNSLTNIPFATTLTPFLSTGSFLAFLIFGSIFDLKSISLMLAAFRFNFIVYLFILVFQFTLLFALFLDFY